MEAGKSKQNSTSPLDFPPDMPNLFHLQHLKLQNVEPVYSDGQVHPAKPKLVEYWKATFYHRMPVGKGTDGKTIYATTAGQYLSFTFKKIIHSLDAQLLPIYTAATRALQLPHGAVFDTTTAVIYRLFENVFLPVLRTTEGEVPMCEGAVRGEDSSSVKQDGDTTNYLYSWKDTSKAEPIPVLYKIGEVKGGEEDTVILIHNSRVVDNKTGKEEKYLELFPPLKGKRIIGDFFHEDGSANVKKLRTQNLTINAKVFKAILDANNSMIDKSKESIFIIGPECTSENYTDKIIPYNQIKNQNYFTSTSCIPDFHDLESNGDLVLDENGNLICNFDDFPIKESRISEFMEKLGFYWVIHTHGIDQANAPSMGDRNSFAYFQEKLSNYNKTQMHGIVDQKEIRIYFFDYRNPRINSFLGWKKTDLDDIPFEKFSINIKPILDTYFK